MMEIDPSMTFNILVYSVSALLSVLLAVLTWVGGHVISSLKDLTMEVKTVNMTVINLEKDLRSNINTVESHAKDGTIEVILRVTQLEERCAALTHDLRILEDRCNRDA